MILSEDAKKIYESWKVKRSTREGKKRHVVGPTKEHVELSDRLPLNGRARNGNTACGVFTK